VAVLEQIVKFMGVDTASKAAHDVQTGIDGVSKSAERAERQAKRLIDSLSFEAAKEKLTWVKGIIVGWTKSLADAEKAAGMLDGEAQKIVKTFQNAQRAVLNFTTAMMRSGHLVSSSWKGGAADAQTLVRELGKIESTAWRIGAGSQEVEFLAKWRDSFNQMTTAEVDAMVKLGNVYDKSRQQWEQQLTVSRDVRTALINIGMGGTTAAVQARIQATEARKALEELDKIRKKTTAGLAGQMGGGPDDWIYQGLKPDDLSGAKAPGTSDADVRKAMRAQAASESLDEEKRIGEKAAAWRQQQWNAEQEHLAKVQDMRAAFAAQQEELAQQQKLESLTQATYTYAESLSLLSGELGEQTGHWLSLVTALGSAADAYNQTGDGVKAVRTFAQGVMKEHKIFAAFEIPFETAQAIAAFASYRYAAGAMHVASAATYAVVAGQAIAGMVSGGSSAGAEGRSGLTPRGATSAVPEQRTAAPVTKIYYFQAPTFRTDQTEYYSWVAEGLSEGQRRGTLRMAG
jgi:hypothetical protein